MIKFRAWHHELERMMRVSNMYFSGNGAEEVELEDEVRNHWIPAYTKEIKLMQSTGLKDKNGKEIFEGDIITNGEEVVDVKNHPTLGFYTVVNGVERFFGSNISIKDFEKDVEEFSSVTEIIGNIYENPELLEVTE